MRVLTIAPLASTHLMSMVPLCWALRTAGHELLVACPPDLVATAHSAGLSAVTIGDRVDAVELVGDAMPADLFPCEAFGMRHTEPGRSLFASSATPNIEHTKATVHQHAALARDWGADVLLYDQSVFTGRVLAALLGVPSISHRWGVDPTSGPYEDKAREELGPLCAELGIGELPAAQLIIDPCPPSLQVEDAPPGRPMRYVAFNGPGTVPDWAHQPTSGRRVCVCMGSTALRITGPRPIQRALAALADFDDLDVVVALSAADREAVGELPTHFRIAESVPLNVFLGTCDLLVGVGGSGTGLTAVSLGVPQLVLPQWADQFDYGRRLAAAGAGISVPTRRGQDDLAGLRVAIRALLDNADYRMAARELRAEIESAPSSHTVAAMIADLVARVPN
jgi:UDP:flavonoid glycosyltransferase YjiC (YdhE family)